jgi:hypothetical protein
VKVAPVLICRPVFANSRTAGLGEPVLAVPRAAIRGLADSATTPSTTRIPEIGGDVPM